MNNFIVSTWFEKRAKLDIQTFIIEDVEFELMALTAPQNEELQGINDYDAVVCAAADMGIAYNRKRVWDDKSLSQDLGMLWGLDELDIESDSDSCVRQRVGEKVCEISGLDDHLQSLLIDGDNPNHSDDTTLDVLHSHATNDITP